MNPRKRRRRFDQPLCHEVGPGDDGLDPRYETAGNRRPVANRKALQLCRQIERALHLAIAGLADPALNDLLVADVRPFPDSSQLLVTLRSATATPVDQVAVLDRIRRAASILRREVAAAINRRKTPELIYQVDQGLW